MLRRAGVIKTMRDLQSSGKKITVAVEGNIGSGKTTFLSHFQKNDLIDVIEEPISKWQNAEGHNLLRLMYQDPRRWGFCFQAQVQLSMVQNHSHPHTTPVKMLERSLHSARHCFVENLFRSGLMSREQKSVLDCWYKWLCQEGSVDVDLFIYLRTSPQVVMQRVTARARQEEKDTVSLELLQRLHDLHEEWLLSDAEVAGRVLVLDGNLPLKAMAQEYQRCDEYLHDMLSSTRLPTQAV